MASRISSAVSRRRGKSPEQAVFGVAPLRLGRDRRPTRLPVRALRTISRCSGLSRQPSCDERARQPVEQFGVARPVSVRAEVVRRLDDAAAEVVLPDAVDHDARRQRMVGPGSHCASRVRGSVHVGRQLGQRVGDQDAEGPRADGLALVLPDPRDGGRGSWCRPDVSFYVARDRRRRGGIASVQRLDLPRPAASCPRRSALRICRLQPERSHP